METEATVNAVKDVTLHGVLSYILVISMHPKDEPHDCGDSTEVGFARLTSVPLQPTLSLLAFL